jgi:hypothetical protein
LLRGRLSSVLCGSAGVFVDLVFGMDRKRTLFPQQREILIDGHAAVVEEHVMVGAKAEYVVRGHRSVVGRPEWAGRRGLRLGLAGSPGECRIPASGGRKGF